MTQEPRMGIAMSDAEVADFLKANEHGVLSLGTDGRSYGLPIAYSYDGANDRLVLGFVDSVQNQKRQFAAETDEATLTVYDYEDVDAWQSVVVRGPLRKLADQHGAYQVPTVFFLSAQSPDGEMVDLDSLERTWYELRIDRATGRLSGE